MSGPLVHSITDLGKGPPAAGNVPIYSTTGWRNDLSATIDVRTYGAVGDGIADDSAAVAAAAAAAVAKVRSNQSTVVMTRQIANIQLYFPGGSYRITQPDSILKPASSLAVGFTIAGDSRYSTQIIWAPPDPGAGNTYLLTNAVNGWQHLTFRDVLFTCETPNASFAYFDTGSPTNALRDYVFERCLWSGTWRYGLQLEGSNSNDTLSFFHCAVYGAWTTFFWSHGSDQHVCHHFYGCTAEYSSGEFVRMDKGGSIRFYGGSWVLTGTGVLITLAGTAHAYGTCGFTASGIRVELRTATSKLINATWNFGSIHFDDCDIGSQVPNVAANTINATFTMSNIAAPIVRFTGCSLMGQHEYVFGANSYQYASRVIYDGCEILQQDDPHDFIVITGATNLGGKPVIHFQRCRGTQKDHIWETSLNWHTSSRGIARRTVVDIKGPTTTCPVAGAFEEIVLPLNAVITNARIQFNPFGSSVTTTWAHTLETTEGTPTVLVNLAPGTQLRLGADSGNTALWFVCDSDAKRTIHFTSNANVNQFWFLGYAIIEYIG